MRPWVCICLSLEDREVVTQWGMDIVPFTRFLHHSALYSKAVMFVGLGEKLKVLLRVEQNVIL